MQTFYNRGEVCHLLGISIATLGRIIAQGDIVAHRIGRQVRISADALDNYLAQHTISAKDCDDESDASTTN